MPRFEQFRLPDAGEGLTEAEIVEWRVAVGERVTVNQPLLEIETAKSLVELPSPYAGAVHELLVEQGATVEVGTPIIVIDTDPEAGPAPAPEGGVTDAADDVVPSPRGEAGPAAQDVGGQAADDVASGSGGGSGAVLVGYGVPEHATARRARRAGPADRASAADEAAAVRPAGDPVADGAEETPPGGTPGVGNDAPSSGGSAGRGAVAGSPSSAGGPNGNGRGASTSSSGERNVILAKPPVRKLARDLGVDLATVSPTGPGGIVTREDVLARSKENEPQTLATYASDDQPWLASGTVTQDGRATRVPVKSVRKRTAEAMVSSAFTAPHVSVFHTVDVTKTMRLVSRLREDREFADVRVTPLLIAMKAVLLAVRRHPEVNASWQDETQEIVYKHYVNLGIAAQTPRGLIVPNIKDAHRLSLHDLALALADLTSTARAGRTTPGDMSDGTITITNVGVFGIDTGTPILNPGESAILAFGAIREQPWVHKGKIKKRHVTQLALSFDHRLIDGGLGSRFLADVAAVLEEPGQGLVWG
ncbi:2-oxo acid dehydrogenase subunit E2 [Cellulomonas sp. APG4]|uniref:dihydrolipoamide acetyltransferase family protein n=1 Tax=Cellulomonas sp. APG4 TaxID=1538656 RepID=UPI00137B8B3A|nr:2-oxo acid dehydrogenase subunit E2 [Cellulomonas sp. APG4]